MLQGGPRGAVGGQSTGSGATLDWVAGRRWQARRGGGNSPNGVVVSTGNLAGDPPASAHQGQDGLSLTGCGCSAGASMTSGPCDVQMMTCSSAAAAGVEAWIAAKERANGCDATVRQTRAAETSATLRIFVACVMHDIFSPRKQLHGHHTHPATLGPRSRRIRATTAHHAAMGCKATRPVARG
jgi:hypothetical protein